MGRDLADAFPAARRVFEEVDDRLGFGLSRLCFEGPEAVLALTEHAQPAILAVSVAAFRALVETSGFERAETQRTAHCGVTIRSSVCQRLLLSRTT